MLWGVNSQCCTVSSVYRERKVSLYKPSLGFEKVLLTVLETHGTQYDVEDGRSEKKSVIP
jgi:hypothetical protein